MNWSALINTIIVCAISVVIEGISATKPGRHWFENLKQSKFAPSMKMWYFVGAVYYIIFAIIAYRQLASGALFSSVSMILLAAIMLVNGLSNFILFKYRSLKWFYLIIYPFGLLLLSLVIVLWINNDYIAVALASLYFVWLFFDLYWAYKLWKLNDDD